VRYPPHPDPLPGGKREGAAHFFPSPQGEREGPAAQRREGEGASDRAGATLVLFLLLLCLLPPDGVLSDNEENYFQLGVQFVSTAPISAYTAVVDGSWHRIVNDGVLGGLVRLLGFAAAQIVTRIIAALAYAVALRALFRRLGLSTVDAVLVLVIFALMGQTLFGGEWLFNGYEAKVAAYALVVAGLAMVLDGRPFAAALLCAVATYFHFLVGGFWFLATTLLLLIEDHRGWRRLVGPTLLFAASVAPLLGVISAARMLAPSGGGEALPTPDVIYSIIRAPHHTAPFLSVESFVSQWLPGVMLAGGMLAVCLAVRASTREARLAIPATWLALLLAYLFLAFIPSFIDRHTGMLGKFFFFRPASLILLLWLALVVAWLNRVIVPHAAMLKSLALLLVVPPFLLNAVNRIGNDVGSRGELSAEKRALAEVIAREAASGAVVLIDPALDLAFLDFERSTGHPMLVSWKFMPTNDPEIREWYRRMEFRRAVFAEGCAETLHYPVRFLVAQPERAAALAKTCGAVIYSGKTVTLVRRSG
jgi:uncharacterized protein DUF6798